MAVSNIYSNFVTKANFTITLANLASSSARQSTILSNASPGAPSALIFVKITTTAVAPTLNSVVEVYLLRGDETPTLIDDAAGASDAAITISNAPLLGTILIATTAANTAFIEAFDTSFIGDLGPKWGIAIKNLSGQNLNGTEGNHGYVYVYKNPQAQ